MAAQDRSTENLQSIKLVDKLFLFVETSHIGQEILFGEG